MLRFGLISLFDRFGLKIFFHEKKIKCETFQNAKYISFNEILDAIQWFQPLMSLLAYILQTFISNMSAIFLENYKSISVEKNSRSWKFPTFFTQSSSLID